MTNVRAAGEGTSWRPLIEQAIGKLPDGARAVFLLHDVEARVVGEDERVPLAQPVDLHSRLCLPPH